jgi:hypothetical protein
LTDVDVNGEVDDDDDDDDVCVGVDVDFTTDVEISNEPKKSSVELVEVEGAVADEVMEGVVVILLTAAAVDVVALFEFAVCVVNVSSQWSE